MVIWPFLNILVTSLYQTTQRTISQNLLFTTGIFYNEILSQRTIYDILDILATQFMRPLGRICVVVIMSPSCSFQSNVFDQFSSCCPEKLQPQRNLHPEPEGRQTYNCHFLITVITSMSPRNYTDYLILQDFLQPREWPLLPNEQQNFFVDLPERANEIT